RFAAGDGAVVVLLDQQPVLRVAVEMRRDERPLPLQPTSVQPDGQAAVALLLDQLVRPLVPDLDAAGAVLPLRDLAFEGGVVERVVLDVNGERSLPRLERHPLRNGPARERAVPLQAEVVVEPAGVVPLDDEDRALALLPPPPEGLGRLLRVAVAGAARPPESRPAPRAPPRSNPSTATRRRQDPRAPRRPARGRSRRRRRARDSAPRPA